MKKIAVILSGCGVFDGAEIHESTITLLCIAKAGAEYQCFAPNINQHHVINHITGEEIPQERNVLIESARIARGNIKNLINLEISAFDALILPGGFGVAKNLSNFALVENEMEVIPELSEIIKAFWKAKKPIGAICISPVIIAKTIKKSKLTIGTDEATINAITKMGSEHIKTNHGEIVVDEENKIVTTPCYMLDASIIQIEKGISKLTSKIIEMT